MRCYIGSSLACVWFSAFVTMFSQRCWSLFMYVRTHDYLLLLFFKKNWKLLIVILYICAEIRFTTTPPIHFWDVNITKTGLFSDDSSHTRFVSSHSFCEIDLKNNILFWSLFNPSKTQQMWVNFFTAYLNEVQDYKWGCVIFCHLFITQSLPVIDGG
jgi:hypothetical protein